MPRAPSLSFIIPIYDDQDSLAEVVPELRLNLKKLGCEEYEILVRAGVIGEAFAIGIADATEDYLGIYSAYNQIDPKSLESIISALGKTDVVVGYISNPEARPLSRRILSRINVRLANIFFGLDLKYYHFCFFRADLAKKVKIFSSSHAAMTEMIVWLIKSGATYVQVPIYLKPHDFSSRSGAFKIANLAKILASYLRLLILVRIMRKRLVF